MQKIYLRTACSVFAYVELFVEVHLEIRDAAVLDEAGGLVQGHHLGLSEADLEKNNL